MTNLVEFLWLVAEERGQELLLYRTQGEWEDPKTCWPKLVERKAMLPSNRRSPGLSCLSVMVPGGR